MSLNVVANTVKTGPIKQLLPCFVLSLVLSLPGIVAAGDEYGSRGNYWKNASDGERAEMNELSVRFKKMIDIARTEATMVKETVKYAEAHGFKKWPGPNKGEYKAGTRYYAINRDRTILLWVTGSEPITNGIKMINSHIDSVRLELKPHPLKDTKGVVTLDTLVHGGIKAYHWVNVPLGLSGRVDLKNGETIWVELGFNDGDPILLIPDLAPHVDKDLRKRTQRDTIKSEELDPIIVGGPEPKATVAIGDEVLAEKEAESKIIDYANRLIEEKYGFTQEDWVSSDIQIVPITKPMDVGLDRSLIAAYGLDDRATGIVNLFALNRIEVPKHTAMAYLVTDEEVGSGWNASVSSEWFRRIIAEIIVADKGSMTDLDVMTALGNSDMITADTTTATNPIWPEPQSPGNAALMHHGLVVKLYGPGKSANSEYMARLRSTLDEANVSWQSHSYKRGYGGGTISRYFTAMNMEVTDWGVGIWSMHSPYPVTSKADLLALEKGFYAFFKSD